MGRLSFVVALAVCWVGDVFAQASELDRLQGVWEITAVVDDGALISDEVVRSRFAADGRFTVSGQTINFVVPGSQQKRTILFVIDDKASPKTIDLAGSEKTSGKGIYLLSDDVFMMCVSEPGVKERPTDFSAKKGSPQLLMTLKRVKPSADKPAPPPPPEHVQTPDEQLARKLFGTWGHQDEDWVTLFTVNSDGTYSSSKTYKQKFGKLFHEDVRSSGTWKVQNGVVLCTITASTDRDMRNQVFSYRIRTISDTEMIAIDQFGNLRREWKTR